uniref:PAP2_C domain-containing protein n=2 Tax=Heligmosomoides polygyrus TaxID=6339 RepID=A0A183GRG4_HELPZ
LTPPLIFFEYGQASPGCSTTPALSDFLCISPLERTPLHCRHRWIVFRRLMMVGSLLYLMRCVTMIVTQVPVADPNFLCAPKYGENATFWNVVLRGLKMVSGVGLNVRGKYTLCGDYIYSGHTIVLVISALFIGEYSPRRWRILHMFFWVVALVGVIFLVISRGHYTLDVILSYFICTRVFWNYHTMVAHPTMRVIIAKLDDYDIKENTLIKYCYIICRFVYNLI